MHNYYKKNNITVSNKWTSAGKMVETSKKMKICPTNLRLYHYAGNNPIGCTDYDGFQTHPGIIQLQNYLKDVQMYNKAIEDASGEILDHFNNGGGLFVAMLIDKIKYNGEYAEKAKNYNKNMIRASFELKFTIRNNLSYMRIISPNENGFYSDIDVKVFADTFNNALLLNFSDQSELGPYKGMKIPLISYNEANEFLNWNEKIINIIYPDLRKRYDVTYNNISYKNIYINR